MVDWIVVGAAGKMILLDDVMKRNDLIQAEDVTDYLLETVAANLFAEPPMESVVVLSSDVDQTSWAALVETDPANTFENGLAENGLARAVVVVPLLDEDQRGRALTENYLANSLENDFFAEPSTKATVVEPLWEEDQRSHLLTGIYLANSFENGLVEALTKAAAVVAPLSDENQRSWALKEPTDCPGSAATTHFS